MVVFKCQKSLSVKSNTLHYSFASIAWNNGQILQDLLILKKAQSECTIAVLLQTCVIFLGKIMCSNKTDFDINCYHLLRPFCSVWHTWLSLTGRQTCTIILLIISSAFYFEENVNLKYINIYIWVFTFLFIFFILITFRGVPWYFLVIPVTLKVTDVKDSGREPDCLYRVGCSTLFFQWGCSRSDVSHFRDL